MTIEGNAKNIMAIGEKKVSGHERAKNCIFSRK